MKKKSLFILLTVFLIAIALTAVAGAAPTSPTDTGVFWWWQDPDTDAPVGSATIVRNNTGITGTVSTSLDNDTGSYSDFAATAWIVVFNNPAACVNNPAPCIEDDLFNPAVMADALYGGGHIIGASEMANFGFHLNAGDNSTSIADLFGMPTDENGEPFGLIYPKTAEVHFVMRSHGPKVPGQVDEMLHTYGGGCVFDAPYGFLPPVNEANLQFLLGDCQDIQFAINQAP